MNIPTETTPAPEDGMVALEESFAYALIGLSVSLTARPRFCYSLTKMTNREAINLNCSPDKARESILALMEDIARDHGDRAPLFIDDSASEEKEVRIYGPTGRRLN